MVRKSSRGSKHSWKKTINTEAEQQHIELRNDANAGILSAANDALFFTDTTGHISSRSTRKKRKFIDDDDTVIRTPTEIEAAKVVADALASATAAKINPFKRTRASTKTTTTTTATTTTTSQPTLTTYKTLKASTSSGDPIADIWAVTPTPADEGYTAHTDTRGFTSTTHIPLVNHKVKRPPLEQTTRGINKRRLQDMIPEEGCSFNPDEGKHQEVMKKVLRADSRARAAQASILRRMNGILPRQDITAAQNASSAMSEDDEDNTRSEESRHIKIKLTTQTERNKEARARTLRSEIRKRKNAKEIDKQLNRVPVIVAELKKIEKLQKKKRETLAKQREENPDTAPKRLGKHRYQETFPEVALTEEIQQQQGSLRKLKPSPFTVRDQFKRFQARSLIEPRVRHNLTRRYALKEYKRNAFKGDLGFTL